MPAASHSGVHVPGGGAITGETAEITGNVEVPGHFRIYLGVAAGVGKTIAMLDEGHRRHRTAPGGGA